MTHDERQLLLSVAAYAAKKLDEEAVKNDTTSNLADQIRTYLDRIGDTQDSESELLNAMKKDIESGIC